LLYIVQARRTEQSTDRTPQKKVYKKAEKAGEKVLYKTKDGEQTANRPRRTTTAEKQERLKVNRGDFP
jgi:hypothetical protein